MSYTPVFLKTAETFLSTVEEFYVRIRGPGIKYYKGAINAGG